MPARAPRPPKEAPQNLANKCIVKTALLLPSRQWVISQLQ